MFLNFFCDKKKILSVFFILIVSFLVISPVIAAPGDYTPLVPIPGVSANAGLFAYLSGVYNFLISIVGILAMAVLVYGGMRYVTSAGNTASVEEAKESINSAIAGLILALVSWLIFATINKDILVLKDPGVGLSDSVLGDEKKSFSCAFPPGDGTPASPCRCIDNPDVPIYGNDGDCNAICSAAHCLVVHPKISLVSDAAILFYTSEQIRDLAIYDGTADRPFAIPDHSALVIDVKKNSISYHQPVTYTYDDNLDGNCDIEVPSDGMLRISMGYALFLDSAACKRTVTPKGLTCAQKYCITDSASPPNTASAMLFFTIFAEKYNMKCISCGTGCYTCNYDD